MKLTLAIVATALSVIVTAALVLMNGLSDSHGWTFQGGWIIAGMAVVSAALWYVALERSGGAT